MIQNNILEIIIGFFIADFLTGIGHWGEDTYLNYNIKIPLLDVISKENEMHHYFPRSILKHSYYDNIKTTLIIVIIILICIFFINKKLLFDYKYLVITIFIFTSFSSIIHRICHMRKCEKHKFILFLQKYNIISSDEHHRQHHVKSNINYCINTPYLNMILDSIYFWRILEFIIYIIFGLKPNRKGKYDDYKSIHTKYHTDAALECPPVINNNDYKILHNKLKEFKNKEA